MTTIEIVHKLKPEIEGDDRPEICIDHRGVWIGGNKLTHKQFDELKRIYEGYTDALADLERINTNVAL